MPRKSRRKISSRASKRKGALLRKMAYQILWAVERGAFADEILEVFRSRLRDPRDRDFLTEVVQGVIRWQGYLDFLIHCTTGGSYYRIKPEARLLLRIGFYQIHFMDKVPVYAAVSATVDAARRLSGVSTDVLNAILRKGSQLNPEEEIQKIAGDRVRYLSVRYSMPQWLVRRWIDRWGPERTERILKACLEKPYLYIRRNPLGPPPDQFPAILRDEGLRVEPVDGHPDCYRVILGNPVRTQAFKKGYFLIQDATSQWIPMLTKAQPGQQILDACAAPGNKTAGILSLMEFEGRIVAMDLSLQRIQLTRQNLQRFLQKSRLKTRKMHIDLIAGDATQPPLRPAQTFDNILVDAPCSNLGVIRRHPEVKWRVSLSEIQRLSRLQGEILDGVAPYVKVGGRLVYAVCTLEQEETFDVVRAFLERHPEFQLEPLDRGNFAIPTERVTDGYFFLTLPDEVDADAFFAVVLRRRSS